MNDEEITAAEEPAADGLLPPEDERSVGRRALSVAVRIVIVIAVLVGTGYLLSTAVDELDWEEVWDGLRSLSDAELLALGSGWLVWLACQGLQTASLLPGLPVRRGILAYLGPAAVASVVPGPSDLPVRYSMLMSWGRTPTEAGLAVTAGGIFNIGIKLLLPAIAGVGLVVSDVPLDGAWRTIAAAAVIVAVGMAVLAFVAASERKTAAFGRLVEPVWRFTMKLLRRPPGSELAPRFVAMRNEALGVLRDRWLIASWGTVVASASRIVLLIMCLRFAGVSESAIGWTGIFVVYAFVQGLTAVPISPGNAGISELAYISMITSVTGTDLVNEVTVGVLLFRVLTWILVILAGLIALAVWRLTSARAERS